MPKTHKFAKDLTPGDRAQIASYPTPGRSGIAMVIAVVPSVQTYRRKVLLVTLRTDDGREIHRTYNECTAVSMISEAKPEQMPTPQKSYLRPYIFADGRYRYESLPVCTCAARRGPEGGVCGSCGGAIPSDKEAE